MGWRLAPCLMCSVQISQFRFASASIQRNRRYVMIEQADKTLQATRDGRYRRRCALARQASFASRFTVLC